MQIDAAINPGNSGGPVFDFQNRVVGVAFAGIDAADNIGYVIPYPVIEKFLSTYTRTGEFKRLPDFGARLQKLENESMRRKFKVDGHRDGVLIVDVDKTSDLGKTGKARPGDVLLAIDDNTIAEDATVAFRGHERIGLEWALFSKNEGEQVKLTLLREGEKTVVESTMETIPYLVPRLDTVDAFPAYLIVGGLVFIPLTYPWLLTQGNPPVFKNPAVGALYSKFVADDPPLEYEGQEIVVLSTVLAADVNYGYHGIAPLQLKAVNTSKVKNLRHLYELVHSNDSSFLEFDFVDATKVVLDTTKVRSSEEGILLQHSIPQPYCLSPEDSLLLKLATQQDEDEVRSVPTNGPVEAADLEAAGASAARKRQRT